MSSAADKIRTEIRRSPMTAQSAQNLIAVLSTALDVANTRDPRPDAVARRQRLRQRLQATGKGITGEVVPPSIASMLRAALMVALSETNVAMQNAEASKS